MYTLSLLNLVKIKSLHIGYAFCCCLFLCCSQNVFAETIYQWTDPWGQVKYSKTPVSGSMISELTELPETQDSSEQQKQEAMLKKMQEIRNDNSYRIQKNSAEKFLKKQNKKIENHCRKLRNMLVDVKLRSARIYDLNKYYGPGSYYDQRRTFPSIRYDNYMNYHYDFLEQDLYQEIREYCR